MSGLDGKPVVWPKEVLDGLNQPVKPKEITTFRRSSIPFNNRTQRIHFNSMETRFVSAKPGPYQPTIDLNPSQPILKKSILKKTNYPIIVNQRLDSTGSTQSLALAGFTVDRHKLSDGDLLLCAQVTDNAGMIFSTAERHIRGAIDMLTFPTVSQDEHRIEALSRIKAMFLIIVEGLWNIHRLYHIQETERMGKVLKIVEEMSASAKRNRLVAKSLYKYNRKVFGSWSKLLRQKGDFRKIDNTKRQQLQVKKRITNPTASSVLYGEQLPENITIYEDVMDIGGTSTYMGQLVTHWAPGILLFRPDAVSDVIIFQHCPMEIQFELILELLCHTRDMMIYSEQELVFGMRNVKAPSLGQGYEKIKTRILDMEFDSFFDPLCALELRLALAELVSRKGIVLNISAQALKHIKVFAAMTKNLVHFVQQLYQGIDGPQRRRNRTILCCLPKFVEYEDLLVILSPAIQASLDAPIPMSAKIHQIMALCYKQLATKPQDDEETIDDEPLQIIKPIRGEGAMNPEYGFPVEYAGRKR